jgi:hypothetical protein
VSGTRVLALALALGALACAGPIIEDEVHQMDPKALERVAVAPFLPAPDFRGNEEPGVPAGGEAAEAAALTTRIASEAFAAAGFDVIPASDIARVFEVKGQVVPHGDVAAFVEAAAREFGATSVLLGTVYRYRARHGGELGATGPASVGYELALHAAPDAGMLWSARFDHTQKAFSEDVFGAWRYPGAGSSWMSAAELARWGADAAAERLAELR